MILNCDNISKKFGKSTVALNNVTLEFSSGIYGLLGANGAGKTTIMQILASLMTPDDGGVVYYNEKNIDFNRQLYRNKLGYWPQECTLPGSFKVEEFLLHIAQFKNIKYKESVVHIDKLLVDFNLDKKRNSLIKRLSGGERQRLGISQAFLGSPEIVILDEPTRGLDIDEQNRMYEFLLNHTDKIILISSHIVRDIEATCSSVIIINEGEILYDGKVCDIMQYFSDTNGEKTQIMEFFSPDYNRNKKTDVPTLEGIYLYLFKSGIKIKFEK